MPSYKGTSRYKCDYIPMYERKLKNVVLPIQHFVSFLFQVIYVSANEDCPEYLDDNTLAPTEVDSEPVFISPETESEPITDTEVVVEPIIDTEVDVEPITDTEVAVEPIIETEVAVEPITDTEVVAEPITDTEIVVEPITDTDVSAEKSKKKFSCKLNENYYQHSIITCFNPIIVIYKRFPFLS